MLSTDVDDVETLESLSQDSCSTLDEEDHKQNFQFILGKISCSSFQISIESVVRIIDKNGGLDMYFRSTPLFFSGLGEKETTLSSFDGRCSITLRLDRQLFQKCWENTPLCTFSDHTREIFLEIPRHISSDHTDMFFHYVSQSLEKNNSPRTMRCTSVDILDRSGKTFLNNVHLHPFHRYHYQFLARECNDENNATVEVWTSRHAGFHICIHEIQQLNITKGRTAASRKSTKKTEVLLIKKSPDMKIQKSVLSTEERLNRSELTKPLVVFTSGIRLTRKEIIQSSKLGLLVNPPFSKIASSPVILFVDSDLIRSVKLLTILPHTKSIFHFSCLKKVLDCTERASDLHNRHNIMFEGNTQVEKENNFSLKKFLSIPINERQAFLSGHNFWVHHKASPQEPPLNDLRSVIQHSGGKLVKSVMDADILILPETVIDTSPLLNTSPEKERISTSKCFCLTPDQLFKSVLQQNKSMLVSHSLPIDFLREKLNLK